MLFNIYYNAWSSAGGSGVNVLLALLWLLMLLLVALVWLGLLCLVVFKVLLTNC